MFFETQCILHVLQYTLLSNYLQS